MSKITSRLTVGFILLAMIILPALTPVTSVQALGGIVTPSVVPPPTNTPPPQPPQPTAVIYDPLITKEANPENARIGDLIRFTINVSNPNSSELKNVSVVDNLSPMVDFVSAVASQGDYTYDPAPHYVIFNLGTLPPWGSAVMQITVMVNDKAQPPTEVRNQAILRLDGIPRFTSEVTVTRIVPNLLPETGNGPGEQEIAIMALAALAVIALATLTVIATMEFVGWLIGRQRGRWV